MVECRQLPRWPKPGGAKAASCRSRQTSRGCLAPSTLRWPPRHLNDRAVWPICVGCSTARRQSIRCRFSHRRIGATAIAATMPGIARSVRRFRIAHSSARQPKQLRTKALRTRPARQPPPHPCRGTNPRPFARAKPMSGPGEFPLPTARRRCRRPRVTFGRPRRMTRRRMAPARCRRARRASRTHRLRRHRLAMKTWRAGDRGHAGGLSVWRRRYRWHLPSRRSSGHLGGSSRHRRPRPRPQPRLRW